MLKALGFIPIFFVGLWSLLFWWQHPGLTEMQVFQAFSDAWWYAFVISVAIWLQPVISWLRGVK